MVQMHPLSTTTATGVSFEAEGGIRNPACQDDDSTDNKQQQSPATAGQPKRGEEARLAARRIVVDGNETRKLHDKSPKLGAVMTVCRTRMPWRFSGNFFIALTVSLIMILIELGLIPNKQVGFYCNDPKLSFKFSGDTISMVTLMLMTTIAPALVMWAVEWSYYSADSYKSLQWGSSSRSRQLWVWYGYYSLGWWYLIFIVEVTKLVVGEPRPHFLDSCRPRENDNCTSGEFSSVYACSNGQLHWFYVNDSDKSFPSGHAALSVFSCVFLVCYLQRRMPERLVLLLLKPWLQCLALLWGLGCSLSRITDNRHHWWDVAIGALLGLLFGLFTVRALCSGFEPASSQLPQHSHPRDAQQANGKRQQSVKKLLSSSSSVDPPDCREMGDVPNSWTA